MHKVYYFGFGKQLKRETGRDKHKKKGGETKEREVPEGVKALLIFMPTKETTKLSLSLSALSPLMQAFTLAPKAHHKASTKEA